MDAPRSGKPDADLLAMFEHEHQRIDDLFSEYESISDYLAPNHASLEDRTQLVAEICQALRRHLHVEGRRLFPSALRSGRVDPALVQRGVFEHRVLRGSIERLERASVCDPFYDAMVRVLAKQVRQHALWQAHELFPEVRASRLDLVRLYHRVMNQRHENTNAPNPVPAFEGLGAA